MSPKSKLASVLAVLPAIHATPASDKAPSIAYYVCDCTGLPCIARCYLPAHLLKKNGDPAVKHGVFRDWNTAWTYVVCMLESGVVNKEEHDALVSWIREAATTGCTEAQKKSFRAAPYPHNLNLHGGELSVTSVEQQYPVFKKGAMPAIDDLKQRADAAAAPRPEKSESAIAAPTVFGALKDAAAEKPDAWQAYHVELCPIINAFYMVPTNTTKAGYAYGCAAIEGKNLAKLCFAAGNTPAPVTGAPKRLSKAARAHIDSLSEPAGVAKKACKSQPKKLTAGKSPRPQLAA